jgi:hypothetical protein
MTASQRSKEAPVLSWGVKQSFRTYVEAAGGSIEVGEGIGRDADGAFIFAGAADAPLEIDAGGKPRGLGKFVGQVRFDAHGGMLSVFLADPWLEIGPETAILSVADSPARDRRVELALLDTGAATASNDGEILIPAKLSKDGWRILGDHYLPMTPLDAVRLKLPAA